MTVKKLLVAAIATVAFAASSVAFAHAKLESSSPAANSVVTPAPTQVRIQFNEPLELPFSKIKLIDEKGTVIEASKPALDPANPKALVAPVPTLHSGAYRVQWSTVTRDGHKVKGEFSFRVK